MGVLYLTAEQWERELADRERRRRLRGARAEVPPGPCTYCGMPDAVAVDHVRGHEDALLWDPANLTRSCIRCNSSKQDKSVEEWRATRLANGLCWPPCWEPTPRRVRVYLVGDRWRWECSFCHRPLYGSARTWRRVQFSVAGHLRRARDEHAWVIGEYGPLTCSASRRPQVTGEMPLLARTA